MPNIQTNFFLRWEMGLRPPFGGDQSYVGRLKHCCSQVAFFPLFGSHHLETTGSMMQHVTKLFFMSANVHETTH